MRHGGNGVVRNRAAQKTPLHRTARNRQKPATYEIRWTTGEAKRRVVAIQPAAKYAGMVGATV
jgi:hypothetical protein